MATSATVRALGGLAIVVKGWWPALLLLLRVLVIVGAAVVVGGCCGCRRRCGIVGPTTHARQMFNGLTVRIVVRRGPTAAAAAWQEMLR